MKPTPSRIAYGGGDISPVMDSDSSSIACSYRHAPAPLSIATVRAGANVSFHWTHWLHSHKGPITVFLAPYEGNVTAVDVNKLEWFMIADDAVDANGEWSTDRMMANDHVWTTQIPADIKPGKYILRHEVQLFFSFVSFPVSPVRPSHIIVNRMLLPDNRAAFHQV
jgi:hypothetical protein